MVRLMKLLAVSGLALSMAQAQNRPPAQAMRQSFGYVNRQLLDMAQDFPADKYDFRPTKEVRTFGEVIVHVISGNVYAAKKGAGQNVKWDELDPKAYHGKDEIVAALKKSIDDGNATLKAAPAGRFAETLDPWLPVIEHAAEHYGQLVVYYRVNGMVPPASRPKSK